MLQRETSSLKKQEGTQNLQHSLTLSLSGGPTHISRSPLLGVTWSFPSGSTISRKNHLGHLKQWKEKHTEKAHLSTSQSQQPKLSLFTFSFKDTSIGNIFSNSEHTVQRNLNQVELHYNANLRIVKPPKQRKILLPKCNQVKNEEKIHIN